MLTHIEIQETNREVIEIREALSKYVNYMLDHFKA